MSTSSSSRTPASKKARYDDSVNDIPHDINNNNNVNTQTHVESSTVSYKWDKNDIAQVTREVADFTVCSSCNKE